MPDDAGFRLSRGAAQQRLAVALDRARGLRRRPVTLGVIALVLAGLAYFVSQWALVGRYQIGTDNAYVRADISMLSAKIDGYVRAVPVADNQAVHAGDVLVEIEPADYQAQLAAAEAALAQAQGQLAAQRAQRAQAAADLERNRRLRDQGFLSGAGWDAAVAAARQAGGGESAAQAAVAAAQAQIEAAQLNLQRTVVRAPIDGVVGDRQVQVGQLVREGSPLMAVVPLQAVYVVANFKETQIAQMRPGQHATITPDIDHGAHLRGVVESLAPASGTQFSMIPTDTATGNFTKIVQRVPVRIRLEPGQPASALLRPGLSATVSVDTRP
ncbi:MAG TPA: HlyD family secretion protein [Caulobacterales bacterium]|nr:HlyD family secretion protein [Caulobacterales bacterium]